MKNLKFYIITALLNTTSFPISYGMEDTSSKKLSILSLKRQHSLMDSASEPEGRPVKKPRLIQTDAPLLPRLADIPIKEEPELENEQAIRPLSIQDIQNSLKLINPLKGKYNCLNCIEKFTNWIVTGADKPKEAANIIPQHNIVVGKEHAFLIDQQVIEQLINYQVIIDLSDNNKQVITFEKNFKPHFHAIASNQLLTKLQDLPFSLLQRKCNVGILYLPYIEEKKENLGENYEDISDQYTGHFINFYVYEKSSQEKGVLLIDPQLNKVYTIENFFKKEASAYKDTFYLWWYGKDQQPSSIAIKNELEENDDPMMIEKEDEKGQERAPIFNQGQPLTHAIDPTEAYGQAAKQHQEAADLTESRKLKAQYWNSAGTAMMSKAESLTDLDAKSEAYDQAAKFYQEAADLTVSVKLRTQYWNSAGTAMTSKAESLTDPDAKSKAYGQAAKFYRDAAHINQEPTLKAQYWNSAGSTMGKHAEYLTNEDSKKTAYKHATRYFRSGSIAMTNPALKAQYLAMAGEMNHRKGESSVLNPSFKARDFEQAVHYYTEAIGLTIDPTLKTQYLDKAEKAIYKKAENLRDPEAKSEAYDQGAKLYQDAVDQTIDPTLKTQYLDKAREITSKKDEYLKGLEKKQRLKNFKRKE